MNTTTRSLVQNLWSQCVLPSPGVIAREIVEDLEAALAQFRLIAGDLGDVVVE